MNSFEKASICRINRAQVEHFKQIWFVPFVCRPCVSGAMPGTAGEANNKLHVYLLIIYSG